MSKVVAIGIDAAEWQLVEAFIDDGTMPTLARLRSSSAHGRLQNIVEYRSELPWTQFLTGRGASANGYWSTVRFDPSTYEAYEQGAHRGRPFYATGDDTFVIAFDVPHSVIWPEVNGVQVTGWGAHSPQYPRAASPAGLLKEIDAVFGPHPAFDNDYHGGWFQPGFIDALADALARGAAVRAEVNLWLMDKFPQWDLFVTVLSESHSAGHHFWHGVDPTHPLHDAPTAAQAASRLRDVYRAIDASIGTMLARVPGDADVVVFAVHGMQANENDVPSLVMLPELIHRLHGGRPLMAPFRRRSSPAVDAVVPSPDRMWASYMHEHFAESTSERVRRAIRLRTPTPLLNVKRSMQWRLRGKRPINGQEFDSAVPEETTLSPTEIDQSYHNSLRWQIPVWYSRHWPTMRYFALPTFSDGKVRVNLAGRERNGLVSRDMYVATLDEIEAELRSCRDVRHGRPVVADVLRLCEADPMDPDGPDADLVVLWAEPVDGMRHPSVGRIGPFPFLRTGEHSSNGFVFVRSDRVPPGDLGTTSAFDITPTIIDLVGCVSSVECAGSSLMGTVPT